MNDSSRCVSQPAADPNRRSAAFAGTVRLDERLGSVHYDAHHRGYSVCVRAALEAAFARRAEDALPVSIRGADGSGAAERSAARESGEGRMRANLRDLQQGRVL